MDAVTRRPYGVVRDRAAVGDQELRVLVVDQDREYPSISGLEFPPPVKDQQEGGSGWLPGRGPHKDNLVQVKAFQIRFLVNGSSGLKFLSAVAETEDQTFARSLLVRSVLQYEWDYYGKRMLYCLFALHVVTFMLLEYAAFGPNAFATQAFLFLHFLVIIVTELGQLRELQASYFSQFSNHVDLAYSGLLLRHFILPEYYDGIQYCFVDPEEGKGGQPGVGSWGSGVVVRTALYAKSWKVLFGCS